MPIAGGAGVPARRSCSRMYCCSNAFTVCQAMQFLGHVPDWRGPTAPAHVEGEALGVERIVGQEVERLSLHSAAPPAGYPPDLELEVDAQIAAGEVADAARLAIVPPALHPTAGPAGRFFDRRVRVSTRACGSPKIPMTVGLGRKPAKRYVSHSRRRRRGVGMRISCTILARLPKPPRPLPARVPAPFAPCFHPLTSTKTQINYDHYGDAAVYPLDSSYERIPPTRERDKGSVIALDESVT